MERAKVYCRKTGLVVAVIAVLLGLSVAAAAPAGQPPAHAAAQGLIRGAVTSGSGAAPAAGVPVVLSAGGEVVAETVTDENGVYGVNVAPGEYDVQVGSPGLSARIEAGGTAQQINARLPDALTVPAGSPAAAARPGLAVEQDGATTLVPVLQSPNAASPASGPPEHAVGGGGRRAALFTPPGPPPGMGPPGGPPGPPYTPPGPPPFVSPILP